MPGARDPARAAGGPRLTRRELVRLAGGAALALALAGCGRRESRALPPGPLGPLEPDPDGLLDLPAGFSYVPLAPAGSTLADGRPVPPRPDGMAAFAGGPGRTVLVRNHELASDDGVEPIGRNPYDPREPGCTVAVVVGDGPRQLDAFVASSGTRRNCAGGSTPWGTWLTCEEDTAEGHGYVFEVRWDDPEGELSRRPIEAMGRFSHEAAAVDPASGAVYLTEDDRHGRTSFLYRYLPDDRSGRPGSLHEGGRLEALAADGAGPVRWIAVAPASAHDEAAEAGARAFRRLEGCCLHAGSVWFTDTVGGHAELGQLFRLDLAGGRLELVYEAGDPAALEAPDNLAATPWGDVWLVEDGDGENRVLGVDPAGRLYPFARAPRSELAGPCFSPDGRTFFVNLYDDPGATLAVTGPFGERLS